jgi:outer membrane protein insertion porin family
MTRFLMVALLAVAGSAQTRPPAKKAESAAPAPKPAERIATDRWPVETLAVEGNRIFTTSQVLAIAGLKLGQVAGRPEFEAARDRLTACGAFETVSYRFSAAPGGGYAAVFQVTEVQQVYSVEFERLGVSSLELTAALKSRDPLFENSKLPATQPVLERFRKWIEEFLASKGIAEKVSGSVRPGAPGDYAVVFQPTRNLPAVSFVSFQGNQLLSAEKLGDAVWGAAIGSSYTEDLFRQILNLSIRPLYDARGHLRVAFPKVTAEAAKDVLGVNVSVTVEEGPAFELSKVVVEGETPIAPEVLVKAAGIKTGETANFDKVNEGLEKMRLALRRAGYMEAKLENERRIDDAKKTVEVAVRVRPGALYSMGKLNITGLDLNAEAAMQRIWTLKEGRPFNPDYPDLFLSRVREQGMFDNLGDTKADVKLNERTHTADVTLKFGGKSGR